MEKDVNGKRAKETSRILMAELLDIGFLIFEASKGGRGRGGKKKEMERDSKKRGILLAQMNERSYTRI